MEKDKQFVAHFGERSEGTGIDTIVVHAMFHPEKENQERYLTKSCIELLNDYEVSTHYFIDPNGAVTQCVAEEARAYHAGVSQMPFEDDNREGVNDFSIGIELIGDWTDTNYEYPTAQYAALAELIEDIATRHPIKNVVGHDHIAPDRKKDPGVHFSWVNLISLLKNSYRVPEL